MMAMTVAFFMFTVSSCATSWLIRLGKPCEARLFTLQASCRGSFHHGFIWWSLLGLHSYAKADDLIFLGSVNPREQVGFCPTAPYAYVPPFGQIGVRNPLIHLFTSSTTTGTALVCLFCIAHCSFAASMIRKLLMHAR
jgi:hypothetical protein